MSDQIPPSEQSPAPRRRGIAGPIAWGGLVLIGLGILFLLTNMGIIPEGFNWWALLILLPAFGMFANAWRAYQIDGERLTRRVRTMAVGGLILIAVAVIFLLGLDWGQIWPIFIILAGLMILANSIGSRRKV